MASSDPAYKILFSQPRMAEDTLRGYVAPHWCKALDFSTLAQMNAEYIGTDLHHRIGDMLWRVEFREGSPLGGSPLANGERSYLLVLFEFQSAVDPDMAWRMHEYVYLLQRHRRGNGTLKAEGREAPRRQGRFRTFWRRPRARRTSSKRATGSWSAAPAANCSSGFVTRTGSDGLGTRIDTAAGSS